MGTNELIKAIKTKDDTEVTQLLSKMDAESVNSKDEYGLSPLHHACDVNNCYAVTKLLSVPGIKVNTRDNNGQTPLHYVRVDSNSSSFVDPLLSHPSIKVNAKDQDGYTALHYACLVDNTQAVEKLLAAQGVQVNTSSNSGSTSTPIVSSVARCHNQVVRIMLEHPLVEMEGLEGFVGRWGGTMVGRKECLEIIEEARRKRSTLEP